MPLQQINLGNYANDGTLIGGTSDMVKWFNEQGIKPVFATQTK